MCVITRLLYGKGNDHASLGHDMRVTGESNSVERVTAPVYNVVKCDGKTA